MITAARTGNVTDLYSLIHRDGKVLRRFDEVEFIDTPLHIAADEGCIAFAMEIINLKPLFARKLNHQGLSPMHIAVRKGHKEMALRFLKVDKDLVSVRGKNCKTPVHIISEIGNDDGLLNRFLQVCPECIRDVTTENRTALHIATENNRVDVLGVLIGTLRKKDYYQEVVNWEDGDGNTALHVAAISNQPKMLKFLLGCKADKNATNHAGLTPLDVAKQQNNRESITILCGCFIPGVSNMKYKMKKQILKYVTKASSLIFHDMDNLSSEDRNALLVILGLLLTASYQATLSPPGGVWQGDDDSNSTMFIGYEERNVGSNGKSVMDQYSFLRFYIPTYMVFIVTFFLTLTLLKPFPHGFRTTLQVLLAFLAICFDQSISFIAPTSLSYAIINLFSAILFTLMVFMCIASKVSKVSVAIVGCWIFPSFLFSISGLVIGVGGIQGLLLFLFLYDEFWKGTILAIGFCLFNSILVFVDIGVRYISWAYPVTFIGVWLFLNLCRFLIKQCCNMRCTKCCQIGS